MRCCFVEIDLHRLKAVTHTGFWLLPSYSGRIPSLSLPHFFSPPSFFPSSFLPPPSLVPFSFTPPHSLLPLSLPLLSSTPPSPALPLFLSLFLLSLLLSRETPSIGIWVSGWIVVPVSKIRKAEGGAVVGMQDQVSSRGHVTLEMSIGHEVVIEWMWQYSEST